MYLAKVNQRVFKRSCCFYFVVRAFFSTSFPLSLSPSCLFCIALHPRDQKASLMNSTNSTLKEAGQIRERFKKLKKKGEERRRRNLHFSSGTHLDPAVPLSELNCQFNIHLVPFRWPEIIIRNSISTRCFQISTALVIFAQMDL